MPAPDSTTRQTRTGLKGRLVAVPESRELEVLAGLLERRGAVVRRCPLVGIRDAPDPAPVLAWLRWFCSGDCQDLVLLTGEGLRRLLGIVDQHAPEMRERFIAELGRVRKIARGPKPGRALRDVGLRSDLVAAEPTTMGVIGLLRGLPLRGRRIGVQLYGTEANLPLQESLRESRAEVHLVAPYVYANAAEDSAVAALMGEIIAGRIDAITFTSSPQVERLLDVAKAAGREGPLRTALGRTVVAAIGPVVAAALTARGVRAQVVPSGQFFMKPLVAALEAAFA